MQALQSAINEFQRILEAAPAQLSPFTDADVSVASAPGRWSRKEILGHLLDSAANNHHRFVRAQYQGELSMPGYAQENWVSTQHYKDRTWNDLIQFWTAYNRHLLHLMQRVPAQHLQIPCRIGDDESVTLEFLMIDYVRHLRHHWDQIQAARSPSPQNDEVPK
jgi:hypothetical protein